MVVRPAPGVWDQSEVRHGHLRMLVQPSHSAVRASLVKERWRGSERVARDARGGLIERFLAVQRIGRCRGALARSSAHSAPV